MTIIKYVHVKFNEYPQQDYMKAKFLVNNLTVGQYVENVYIDDLFLFEKYIEMLTTERNLCFIIKKVEIGAGYNVLNNGYIKHEKKINKLMEKFTY